jgi:hypothetical protein
MKKHFRHQETKTQRKILTNGFTLCFGVFVATHSPPPAGPGLALE